MEIGLDLVFWTVIGLSILISRLPVR